MFHKKLKKEMEEASELTDRRIRNIENDVIFQSPKGFFYKKICELKNINVYALPSTKEFSFKSWYFSHRLFKTYDMIMLHSPRLPYLMPLILYNGIVFFRLSNFSLSSESL